MQVSRESFAHTCVLLGLLPPTSGDEPLAVGAGSAPASPDAREHAPKTLSERVHSFSQSASAKEVSDLKIVVSAGAVVRSRRDARCFVDGASEVVIDAHAVVLAGRCSWFRRLLLSGMREAVDRSITVHETNEALFRLFLEHLYGRRVETEELGADQLVCLVEVADKYEVCSFSRFLYAWVLRLRRWRV